MQQCTALASGSLQPAERRRLSMSSPRMNDELENFAATVRTCRICVENPVGRPLPHEPRPVLRPSSSARILIASQAPGTKVHVSGMPFTDASGDRLRNWLGVNSEEFYDTTKFAIVPMGFCFPGQDAKGGDLPPRRECAPAWRAPLMALMPQVDLVLTIGLYAQSWHLGAARRPSLTETVMNWRTIWDAPGNPKVLPLPHPSWRNTGWLKRNPWFEMDLLPFLRSEIRYRLG
ncbi:MULTISPECIES: uracil-DNA glycosylase family protein [unclassified Mesorhizobium]|uniref:uracil-DNA glycosylase family protein n=1 Tax=unclassified Mesorhizobium TaxID=325217 RepID=UPI000FCC8B26|nr:MULTISPECIES: uracil-DNA glycosylase family protein [unclassified Mesorhizobium]RUU30577.1 uracil-DNA glycosylase family protein [Mesorhizobium sp. M6A.T.Ce.TU.002.03.1.1]RUV03380.1 uracil-DNA glycosylase family protein [Mesorhizobium sp. M6A.T.Cr.TU.017.01.1.1]RVB75541.1 uracil-DNA glycosylase family protein [Mesorhizobium sp. M6A.T.Cr.TU.014.01.1.1]RWP54756.1 MAG: uracil-DNA glycosylase family protein [Mesorhizobium sp.]RWP72732.1 MAG: uracil-DNA glycosylase family protein [Mesorhizobium 